MIALSCSADSLAAGEQPIGSAPEHTGWLCLQQAGPWGRKALVESRLDVEVGRTLTERGAAAGVRPCLIRRPGRETEDEASTGPWLFLAHTAPENPWMLGRRLADAAEVLEVDLAALARGDRDAFPGFDEVATPMLFVCTNAKRDACCARLGRPLAAAAAAAHPGRVWEISHTSGHRFAPTTVLLPSGHLHGRVLDASGLLAAADRGELVLHTWRGRTSWPAPGQAAEEAVRRTEGIVGLDDLAVERTAHDWLVRHRDGRNWRVEVTSTTTGERAESCGKSPAPVVQMSTRLVGFGAEGPNVGM